MSQQMQPKVQLRDAASVLLLRRDADQPEEISRMRVLMGRRSQSAAFMPDKYVFPGGAVDPQDTQSTRAPHAHDTCRARLAEQSTGAAPQAILNAAARELREETGLQLRAGAPMTFVCRAITPLGQPRRFDARFFVAQAHDVVSHLDDFSQAEDELTDLNWISLPQALDLNIPRVTALVLTHVQGRLASDQLGSKVPVFGPNVSSEPTAFLA